MITNTGKSIIGKYLIGQAPAYASYIAIGCGATPLLATDTLGDYTDKTELDLEMFRVPIISRGFISDDIDGDGIKTSQVVLTAELPAEERYEITEVGIYSAGNNTAAASQDSRMILSFSSSEGWTQSGSSLQYVADPLDDLDALDNIIRSELGDFFIADSDNRIFSNPGRYDEGERGRFLNNMIMIKGDTSDLDIVPAESGSGNPDTLEIATDTTSTPIQLSNKSVSIGRNSPTDELVLGLSVVRRDGSDSGIPDEVRLIIEFSDGATENTQYARMHCIIDDVTDTTIDFSNSRYVVVRQPLSDLDKTTNFSWSSVNTIKIYGSVIASTLDSAPTSYLSGDYFIALDALRIDNKTDINPIYGLTGYTVVKTPDGLPIIKKPNTSGFIEFRFVMDVV